MVNASAPRVVFVGAFGVPWTTESELRRAFHAHGWAVQAVEERDVIADPTILAPLIPGASLVLYVMSQGLAAKDATALWDRCRDEGMVTACFHLDLFYGLGTAKGHAGIPRSECPARHPMFRVDHAFTADGGHDAEFARDGVNHHWLPPAVSEWECIPGTPRHEWAADVTFVGSWQGYHPESTHRRDLIRWLRRHFGPRLQLVPPPGQPAVRQRDLRDLYASTRVVVGDSCMMGHQPIPRYCSDRVPETLGRGGFLLHPETEGVFPDLWRAGEHLDAWPAGDWDALGAKIEHWLARPEDRREVAEQGRVHTLVRHTYTSRVETMLRTMGLWDE